MNGVRICAVDQGTGIFREVPLTVTQPQLFIALGTGDTLFRIGTALYAREWVIRVTDGQGNARVCVFYPKDVSLWANVDITAKASLFGTEVSSSALFTLEVLRDDLDDPQVSPPNLFSPFGSAQVPNGAGGTRPATCATP